MTAGLPKDFFLLSLKYKQQLDSRLGWQAAGGKPTGFAPRLVRATENRDQ